MFISAIEWSKVVNPPKCVIEVTKWNILKVVTLGICFTVMLGFSLVLVLQYILQMILVEQQVN